MKRKNCLSIFLALLVLFSCACADQTPEEYLTSIGLSQNNFDHDYFMEYVLFGQKYTRKDDPTYYDESEDLSPLAMIEFATTLCIDQFNNNQESTHDADEAKLKRLRKKVGGLPKSVDELNPDADSQRQLSGRNHRTYTHKGWKYEYDGPGKPGDLAHTEKRETILRNTVEKVFNLKSFLGIFGTEKDERVDCYCRLFYYIHLLGDCFEDADYLQANGSSNGQKMPLGRIHPSKSKVEDIEDSDIITELIWVCDELFSESETNYERYRLLKKELKRVEIDIRNLYSGTGGINSKERYEEYHVCVCDLMQVLIQHMPALLRNEEDFYDAFIEFI